MDALIREDTFYRNLTPVNDSMTYLLYFFSPRRYPDWLAVQDQRRTQPARVQQGTGH